MHDQVRHPDFILALSPPSELSKVEEAVSPGSTLRKKLSLSPIDSFIDFEYLSTRKQSVALRCLRVGMRELGLDS